MAERLFSASWHRVSGLKPRLRPHARLHRHVYRGQPWYVLHDDASGRVHRFSPVAHRTIGLMDGERTVAEIWDATNEALGDDAPTQDQVVELLGQLHRADVLLTQARPDAEETHERHVAARRVRLAQRLRNPIALRIPLLDPDRMLDRLRPLARALFSVPAAVAWLLVVACGLAAAGAHAPEIVAHAAERALAPHNLLLIALVFPLVKALHELGHALAVKRWGGEVHEVGVMLLVLAPLPYVDASSAAAFPDKARRIVVSAAGIAVELALAAVAVVLWTRLEPGTLRDVAFDVMLIGGVSTVLFNGNPLLRFDGYYVLADAIEIPNLAGRSRRYLGYLMQRWVFGVAEARSPVTADGEAPWFVLYGVAAALYRVVIAVAIVTFVAGKFFVVGLVLAAVAALQLLLVPLFRQVTFLCTSPALARQRARAIALTSLSVAALAAATVLVPVPLATRAQGVVWLPEDAQVRPAGSGFVERVHVARGERVSAGQALLSLEDPLRDAEMQVLEARIAELEARRDVVAFRDRVEADVIGEELLAARAELARELERRDRLTVVSPADGVYFPADDRDPVGRYVRQGDPLGWVVDRSDLTVRVVVEQPDIGLVRERLEGIDVRFADRTGETLHARLVREVPAAHYLLPSKVLGREGGGVIPVDPTDQRGLKVTRKVFQLDLEVADAGRAVDVGQRVHVRFGHGTEPLSQQWARRLGQIFLRGFGV